MQTVRALVLGLLVTLSMAAQQSTSTEAPVAEPQYSPDTLTLPAGTFLTVRVDQLLSSDASQPGDGFTATLVQPLVAQGRVMAVRGQTVGGRVSKADKAGRSKGTSRLGVEITELSLVDGRQVRVRTSMIEYRAGTSVGRDAAAVATTTGMGAAIGAAADGGFGAGIGAIAGAAAGAIGVMATRGRPTIVYPEAQLTFRLEDDLSISTENSARAFRVVTQSDYEQQTSPRLRSRATSAPRRYYYFDTWGYWGSPYPYYSPYFFGPSLHFYSGPAFRFGGRGFGRRR